MLRVLVRLREVAIDTSVHGRLQQTLGREEGTSYSLRFLPTDVLEHLCQYLEVQDVLALAATCKGLRAVTMTPGVWASLVLRTFALEELPKDLGFIKSRSTDVLQTQFRQLSLQRPVFLSDAPRTSEIVEHTGSRFRKVLHIDGRRDLNFTTVLRGVPPGQYNVVWRLMLQPGYVRGYCNFRTVFGRPADPKAAMKALARAKAKAAKAARAEPTVAANRKLKASTDLGVAAGVEEENFEDEGGPAVLQRLGGERIPSGVHGPKWRLRQRLRWLPSCVAGPSAVAPHDPEGDTAAVEEQGMAAAVEAAAVAAEATALAAAAAAAASASEGTRQQEGQSRSVLSAAARPPVQRPLTAVSAARSDGSQRPQGSQIAQHPHGQPSLYGQEPQPQLQTQQQQLGGPVRQPEISEIEPVQPLQGPQAVAAAAAIATAPLAPAGAQPPQQPLQHRANAAQGNRALAQLHQATQQAKQVQLQRAMGQLAIVSAKRDAALAGSGGSRLVPRWLAPLWGGCTSAWRQLDPAGPVGCGAWRAVHMGSLSVRRRADVHLHGVMVQLRPTNQEQQLAAMPPGESRWRGALVDYVELIPTRPEGLLVGMVPGFRQSSSPVFPEREDVLVLPKV